MMFFRGAVGHVPQKFPGMVAFVCIIGVVVALFLLNIVLLASLSSV